MSPCWLTTWMLRIGALRALWIKMPSCSFQRFFNCLSQYSSRTTLTFLGCQKTFIKEDLLGIKHLKFVHAVPCSLDANSRVTWVLTTCTCRWTHMILHFTSVLMPVFLVPYDEIHIFDSLWSFGQSGTHISLCAMPSISCKCNHAVATSLHKYFETS